MICLQETKVTDEAFPRLAVHAMGYPHLLVHGQKGYNGVAIASRLPFEAQGTKVWCGRDDRRHAFVRLRVVQLRWWRQRARLERRRVGRPPLAESPRC